MIQAKFRRGKKSKKAQFTQVNEDFEPVYNVDE